MLETVKPGSTNTTTISERRCSDSSSNDGTGAEAVQDAPNLQTLFCYCNLLGAGYILCSIVSFCSLAYTGAGSALDAVLVMSDVVCIDISSALFITAGCAAATLYAASEPTASPGKPAA